MTTIVRNASEARAITAQHPSVGTVRTADRITDLEYALGAVYQAANRGAHKITLESREMTFETEPLDIQKLSEDLNTIGFETKTTTMNAETFLTVEW